MKYSAIALSALATAAAAQPVLLNSAYELKEGTPFELKYSGCEDGCTIVLQTGEPTHLTDVTGVTATASGTSFTWTPSGLPSGTYSFKITNNKDGSENYSVRFEYTGTGTLTSSASSASATSAASSSSASASGSTSRSSSASASTTATGSSSASSVTSGSTTTPATSATSSVSVSRNATITTLTTASSKPAELTSTKKSEEPAKTTAATTTAATTVPNSGATRLGSSLALVAGAVMAMVYLN